LIPSYFDFVRVRNYFKSNNMNFCSCSEYTKANMVTRARSNFFHGRQPFMLLTERFHFFMRYKIRGVRNIVFYQLPEKEAFYSEFLNFIESSGGNNTVLALHSKYDNLALERVVGSGRCAKITAATDATHMFC
jgi:U3 small nucleolar RNA-associated protein 25